MPEYTYRCEKCQHKFSVICSIKDYQEQAKCENCSCNRTYRLFQEDLATLSTSIKLMDSEVKTLGHLANRNADKLSEDHKQHLAKKHNSYKEQLPEKPLPSGMTRIPKPKSKIKWTDNQ